MLDEKRMSNFPCLKEKYKMIKKRKKEGTINENLFTTAYEQNNNIKNTIFLSNFLTKSNKRTKFNKKRTEQNN